MNYRMKGVYRPTVENFSLMEVLAVANAVDARQGFVKSGEKYHDVENDTYVKSNLETVLGTLRTMADKEYDYTGQVIEPTENDREAAREIYTHFDQIILMDKLSDNLIKTGHDGRSNDFNLVLADIFDKATVDVNKEMAMVVSLPNSRRISDRRDVMRSFHQANQTNGYIGKLANRSKITGEVKDVKFIAAHNLYLVTLFTSDNQIAKYFMKQKLQSNYQIKCGETITVLGTVKDQSVNKYTDCQETMLKRVKVVGHPE
jgi:hypothetical protein